MKAIQDWRWAGEFPHRFQQSFIVRVPDDQIDAELVRCADARKSIGGLPAPNIVDVPDAVTEDAETAQTVIARCLDFWRDDLYTSNGVATPFAAKAIIGELKLAGFDLT